MTPYDRAPYDHMTGPHMTHMTPRALDQMKMKISIRYYVLLVLLASSCSALKPQKGGKPGDLEGISSLGTKPAFVTSDRNGGWSNGGYYIHNNMWNSTKYSPCTETLYAWSFDNWYVIAKMNNKTGDGAVKTYANVHKNYDRVPIAAFNSITSTFAETSPRVGIYNFAYDIWVNGIASPGCTEIMIWTENVKQVPGGNYVQDVAFGGRTYKVYKRSKSGYIAFVPTANFTSGTMDLLEVINWTIAKGWLSAKSTLDQICFGAEIVSTDDTNATFRVTNFSINEDLQEV